MQRAFPLSKLQLGLLYNLCPFAEKRLTVGEHVANPLSREANAQPPLTPYVRVAYYPYQYRQAGGSLHLRCCLPYQHGITKSSVTKVRWHFQPHQGNLIELNPTHDLRVIAGSGNDCSQKDGDGFRNLSGYFMQMRMSELELFDAGKYWCSFTTDQHGVFTNFSNVIIKSKSMC